MRSQALMEMKSRIYRCYWALRQAYWRISGGRRLRVFGESLKVTADTVFPGYRSHPLPAGSHKSRIVRHADFVQMHALVDFIERARRPLTVVEVGAHHGAYAVLMGQLLRQHGGRCIAIEPNPSSFATLCRNVRLNDLDGVVTCLQNGISDIPGELSISDRGSQSQLVAEGGGETVTVKTLAQILSEQGLATVDLLLIDVEGAELPVLRGFPWNDLPLPKIFCELHPYAWPDFGYTAEDFSAFLTGKGLHCIDMYFTEHRTFPDLDYIGPTVLMR